MTEFLEIRSCGEVRQAKMRVGVFKPDAGFSAYSVEGIYAADGETEADFWKSEYEDAKGWGEEKQEEAEEFESQLGDLQDAVSDAITELTALQMDMGDDEARKLAIQNIIDGLK